MVRPVASYRRGAEYLGLEVKRAIFAYAPRSASVVALDEVSAVVVELAALDNLVRSSWLGLFVKALADRFLDLDARLAQGC